MCFNIYTTEKLIELLQKYDKVNKDIQEKAFELLRKELKIAETNNPEKLEEYKQDITYKIAISSLKREKEERDAIFEKSKLRRTIIKGLPNNFLEFREDKTEDGAKKFITVGPPAG